MGGIREGLEADEAFERAFGLIGNKLGMLHEQFTPEAWQGLSRVMNEFTSSDVLKAKGAAEAITIAARYAQEGHAIRHIEFKRERTLPDGRTRLRIYDMEVEVEGKILQIEVKAWSPESIEKFFFQSFRGVRNADAPDSIPQIRTDLTNALNQFVNGGADNVTQRIFFDARVDDTIGKEGIVSDFLDKLKKDKELTRSFLIESGAEQLFDAFNREGFDSVAETIGDMLSVVININGKIDDV